MDNIIYSGKFLGGDLTVARAGTLGVNVFIWVLKLPDSNFEGKFLADAKTAQDASILVDKVCQGIENIVIQDTLAEKKEYLTCGHALQ